MNSLDRSIRRLGHSVRITSRADKVAGAETGFPLGGGQHAGRVGEDVFRGNDDGFGAWRSVSWASAITVGGGGQ